MSIIKRLSAIQRHPLRGVPLYVMLYIKVGSLVNKIMFEYYILYSK